MPPRLGSCRLHVPAPWGVGIVLGLKTDWVCSHRLDQAPAPGVALEIIQGPGGPRFMQVWRQLDELAQRRLGRDLPHAAPMAAFLPGPVGWALLGDVSPHAHDPGLCVWLLGQPRPLWLDSPESPALAGPGGGACPAPAPAAWPAGALLAT